MNNIYGLLGEKLGHSMSDKIHNKIFDELSINANYNYFEVDKDKLQDAFCGFKALKVKGINVTIPYKVDVIKYLDSMSPEAEKIGAVNTIDFSDGKLKGYNTDYYGFGAMLEKNEIKISERNVYILGSGGVSKAVAQYYYDKGAGIINIVSRNKQKAEKAFQKNIANFKDDKLKFISYDEFYSKNLNGILTNCTPCGMFPNVNSCPVDKEIISNFEAVIDLIYNPKETTFLKYAKDYGIKYVNGMYMLVSQAVKAEGIWNNIKISPKQTDDIVRLLED